MNPFNDYSSTGVSALSMSVVSRRFSDEMEDGRASPSSPSSSPTLSFLSAPPAASAAKGLREEAGPTNTATEKTQEVMKEHKKADRRARDLAAVRLLTAQISDMLARQRGDESEPAAAAAEPPAASESVTEPAAVASEPRRQQQDKKEEEKSQDSEDEDEWANASLAFIVDDYQRERRRDHDSYSKILGTTSRRRRRARRSPSARLGASAPELGGGEVDATTTDFEKVDMVPAATPPALLPAPISKMDPAPSKSANANHSAVPIPGGAGRMRCNTSHALSA